MARRIPGYMSRERQERAAYYRTEGDMLVNAPDGWEVDQRHRVDWTRGGFFYGGDTEDDGACPAWWIGDDRYSEIVEGRAIGPNGPWITAGSGVLPSVTRSLEVIVNSIVKTNWNYQDANGNYLERPLWIDDPMLIGRVPGFNGPAFPAGLRLDGHSFYSTFLSHAVLWGLGAFICQEAADGTPLAGSLRILNPYMVGLDDEGHYVIDPNGEVPVATNFDGRFIMGGRVWRLVTLRGFAPNDGRWPEGVLTRHFHTMRMGARVSEYVANTMRSGVPQGFLKVTQASGFNKDKAEELKADWMRAHGRRSKREIAVLGATVDFEPISISPIDAQAQELLRLSRSEVALAFGLDPIWVGEGASGMSYNNNSDRRRDLIDTSLSGWSESLMAVLTLLLPYGTRVSVHWASFTAASFEIQVPMLAQAVAAGLMTEMEARQYMGLEKWMGHDPDYQRWLEEKKAAKAITAGGTP